MWVILSILVASPHIGAWAVEIEGKAVVAGLDGKRALPAWAPVFEGETVTGRGRLRLADGRMIVISREKPWRAAATKTHPALAEAWAYAERSWIHRRDPTAIEFELRAALPSGPVLGGRVGFWWSGAGERAAEIEVFESPIGTSLWRQAGFTGGHGVYPGTAPRLWPGKTYRWKVRVPEVGEAQGEFEVVATEDVGPHIAAVNGIDEIADLSEGERWILRSAALQARGLFMDGLEELRRLDSPLPPLAEALRRRAWASAR